MRVPSWAGSVALHVCGIAALLLLRPPDPPPIAPSIVPVEITAPRKLRLPAAADGGGGSGDARPASRGHLPRMAPLPFTPPRVQPIEIEPALPVEPAVTGAQVVDLAGLPLGDPNGLPGPPSGGRGTQGGIGDGMRGGIGDGVGPRVYSVAAVSSAPVLIYKVEPEFSEEARRARFNGTVVLRVIIDERGLPTNIEVVRAPGLGLGERAVASVAQWRFRPGRRDGKPMPVWATVEVSFSLL